MVSLCNIQTFSYLHLKMGLLGWLRGNLSSSISGALRQTWSPSQVRDTRTKRGCCLPVTMWPSSVMTSQWLQWHIQDVRQLGYDAATNPNYFWLLCVMFISYNHFYSFLWSVPVILENIWKHLYMEKFTFLNHLGLLLSPYTVPC